MAQETFKSDRFPRKTGLFCPFFALFCGKRSDMPNYLDALEVFQCLGKTPKIFPMSGKPSTESFQCLEKKVTRARNAPSMPTRGASAWLWVIHRGRAGNSNATGSSTYATRWMRRRFPRREARRRALDEPTRTLTRARNLAPPQAVLARVSVLGERSQGARVIGARRQCSCHADCVRTRAAREPATGHPRTRCDGRCRFPTLAQNRNGFVRVPPPEGDPPRIAQRRKTRPSATSAAIITPAACRCRVSVPPAEPVRPSPRHRAPITRAPWAGADPRPYPAPGKAVCGGQPAAAGRYNPLAVSYAAVRLQAPPVPAAGRGGGAQVGGVGADGEAV